MQIRLHKGLCPIVIIIAAEFLYRHDDTAWRTKKFWANQLVKFNYKRKRYCNFIFRFAWFLWWVKALHTGVFLWMSLRLIVLKGIFLLLTSLVKYHVQETNIIKPTNIIKYHHIDKYQHGDHIISQTNIILIIRAVCETNVIMSVKKNSKFSVSNNRKHSHLIILKNIIILCH